MRREVLRSNALELKRTRHYKGVIVANGQAGKKIQNETVARIKDLLDSGVQTTVVAIRTGVSESQVRNIKRGYSVNKSTKDMPRSFDPEAEMKALFEEDKVKPKTWNAKPKDNPNRALRAIDEPLERLVIADIVRGRTLESIAARRKLTLESVESIAERMVQYFPTDASTESEWLELTESELRKTRAKFSVPRELVPRIQEIALQQNECIAWLLSCSPETANVVRKFLWAADDWPPVRPDSTAHILSSLQQVRAETSPDEPSDTESTWLSDNSESP